LGWGTLIPTFSLPSRALSRAFSLACVRALSLWLARSVRVCGRYAIHTEPVRMSAEDIVSSPRWRLRSTSPHLFPPDSEDDESSDSPPPHPLSMHSDREWWSGIKAVGGGLGVRKSNGNGSPLMSLSRTAPDHAPAPPQPQLPCAECDRGAWAQHYCCNCAQLLCAACADQHRWQKRTREHTLNTLKEWMPNGQGKDAGHVGGSDGDHDATEGGQQQLLASKQASKPHSDGASGAANESGVAVATGRAAGGRGRGQRRLPSMDNVLHAVAGCSLDSAAAVPAAGGGREVGARGRGGRTGLLWRLMSECLADDKETIQREIVRHVEYTLACTRLSFQKKHAFQAAAHSLRDRMVNPKL